MSPQARRTPLHDFHQRRGGRLVDFAGWELPIHYDGVVAEHNACRSGAGLFDVSHMGVVQITADDPTTVPVALEQLTPAGITTLDLHKMRYSLLTNDEGGVIDDCMITNLGEEFVIVVNAARRDVDLLTLRDALSGLDIVERTDLALLALQGPKAEEALATLCPDVSELFFLDARRLDLGLTAGVISRSGYTGEDGFEICVPADDATALAEALLATGLVTPCGLGARDTLRLEAGLCLYGHELSETISPVEADLVWSMPKRRREAGDFPGAARILAELADGPARLRVGLAAEGRRPVRDGAPLRSEDGEPIGVVTSGGYGPSIEGPAAMGYVRSDLATTGTRLLADVRGRSVPVTVADLPFVPHRYRRQPRI